ncbi:DUF748 domain-containing protein [Draconibacterium sediminis]|uniref:DUF748 domain-containing protein n=1 Tax=Draconibacterium sediminis TaxID=1544798 RepID=A0A0D8JG36_9BACT|nr:DUF748 domain-containing protein [Draconibacterium sediminis]KJF45556.1 hypothetical protein LH29_09450 [Draconibacterium sediminis]
METKEGKQKTGKRKRIVLIVLLALTLIVVVALALAPDFIKNYINKNGAELSGRTITIEKIKYNYFTSTLQVFNMAMYEQNNTDVFVGFDTLLLNLKPLRFLKHEINVQQFQLVNPYSQVIQTDTVFNFSDIIEFFDTEEAEADEDTTQAKPYRLNLNLLEIKNGTVSYTDTKLNHNVAMEDISFLIPQIYWGGDESSADLAFNVGHGGSISTGFDYNSKTGNFSGDIKLNKLVLNIALPYIKEYMQFNKMEGTLDATAKFNGNENDLTNFSLSGNAVVDSLMFTDLNDKNVLGVAKATLDLSHSKPLLYQAEIGKIEITRPYVYFALIDSLSNFEKMIVPVEAETVADTTESEENEPYDIIIDKLVIDDGLIDFSDQRLQEVFNYELSQVHVDMDSLSLNSNWLEINSNMKLNKRGNLEAELGLNPYDPFQHIELNYVLSDFQLPDINIYSKHYAGLPILFGDMYYRNKTSIINKQLNSENELVIRNVEMGRKSGGLYDIPIKLALFILKDKNGDVILDIPVTGDLSDPRTDVGKIVWNTFKGFMGKIASSPFRALGNLLGADPKELEEITLAYSDTTLTRKQHRSLDLLLELEQQKPGLLIEMQYMNDRKLERIDAAAQLVQDNYTKETGKNPRRNNKEYLEYLKNETQRDSLVMQDYERLLAPETKVDSVIISRENNRIQMVNSYLHEHNDSTTIRVLEYDEDEVLNIGSRPQFKISYKLAEDEAPLDDSQSGQ